MTAEGYPEPVDNSRHDTIREILVLKKAFSHSPPERRSDERKEKSGAKGDAARESHQLLGERVASTKAGGHPDGT